MTTNRREFLQAFGRGRRDCFRSVSLGARPQASSPKTTTGSPSPRSASAAAAVRTRKAPASPCGRRSSAG